MWPYGWPKHVAALKLMGRRIVMLECVTDCLQNPVELSFVDEFNVYKNYETLAR
jgi:hypothetical protein